MQRFVLVTLLLIAGLGLGKQTHAWQSPQNLLQNPSFEGEYSAWNYINEVQVAPGWTPWWRSRHKEDPPAMYFKPEYKRADGNIYPERVHSGQYAQQWFTFYASHQAGMYQQVFNVTPGTRYRFTIWAHVWSSTKDDPGRSENPAYPNLQVGIDPTGQWNPWSSRVIWSEPYTYFDTWGQLAVEAVAQDNIITVFMRSEPNWPVKHNDTYWDSAELIAVGAGGAPIVQPSATSPPPAGSTPAPSATSGPPRPTATCAPPPGDWVTYMVRAGDTLAKLAQASGTTVQAIVTANCIRNINIIEVGQELLLPSLPATLTPVATATISTTSTSTPPIQTPISTPSRTAIPTASRTPTTTPFPTAIATVVPSPTQRPSATVELPATQPLPTADSDSTTPAGQANSSLWGLLILCVMIGLSVGFALGRRGKDE